MWLSMADGGLDGSRLAALLLFLEMKMMVLTKCLPLP